MPTETKRTDVMVRISKDTRTKLKLQATKVGLTLKEYLRRMAIRPPYEKIK